MALLTSVFKVRGKNQIGFLKIDATIRETHNSKATVTKNEVEDGSQISDHVKLSPETLTMECFVSDVPISTLGLGVSVDDFLGKSRDFLENGDSSSFEGLVKNETRSPQEAWNYLKDLQKKRFPFSVVTSLERYENMIVTGLTSPRTVADGNGVTFTVQLEKIRIVKSSIVTIPAFKLEAGGTANSASSKGKLGKQATKEATEAQKDNSSLLLKGFKKAGIF